MDILKFVSFLYRNLLPKFIRVRVLRILTNRNPLFYLDQLLSQRLKIDIRKEILFALIHKSKVETLLDAFSIAGLLESVQATEAVPSDIIELGTYKGGSSIMMARFLKKIGSKRQNYVCDTFEGHPYNDQISSQPPRKGEFSDTSVPYVKDKFRRFGVEDKITIIEGLFEDTLLSKLGEKRFSLALVDCDLYKSTKYALDFLHQRMEDGGRIVLHDYGRHWWGLTKATNEWCQRNGVKINLYPIPHIKFTSSSTSSSS